MPSRHVFITAYGISLRCPLPTLMQGQHSEYLFLITALKSITGDAALETLIQRAECQTGGWAYRQGFTLPFSPALVLRPACIYPQLVRYICIFCSNPPRSVQMHPLTSAKGASGVYCTGNVKLSPSLTDEQQVTFARGCAFCLNRQSFPEQDFPLFGHADIVRQTSEKPKKVPDDWGLIGRVIGFNVTDTNTKGKYAYLDNSQSMLCNELGR